MQILPYDYLGDRSADTRGLARTATLIAAARKAAANSILLDNGDFLHGTPMGDALARTDTPPGGPHPMIAAMNLLGYDAATLGNHEFDHGAEFLTRALSQADFPVVSANTVLDLDTDPAADRTLLPPYAILDREVADDTGARHNLRIGVIGFLPPGSIPRYRDQGAQARVRDILDTARLRVPQLRAKGADVIVALAHTGIGAAQAEPGMENAIVPLAAIDGIDAIIGGHTHQVFPGCESGFTPAAAVDARRGTIHGKPVVLPGFWGSHLGVIDLDLVRAEKSGWQVHTHAVEARPIYSRAPTGEVAPHVASEPRIARLAQPHHVRILSEVRTPVGHSLHPLNSYFALVTPCSALVPVHAAQTRFARGALKGSGHAALPILSSAAPYKCGGRSGPDNFTDIVPGNLTLRAIADLYPHPNDLVAYRLGAAGLTDWLERAASVFNTIRPGSADQTLLCPGTPGYLFENVSGLTYRIDLSAAPRYCPQGRLLDPSARRVRALEIDGVPLHDGQQVILVTNSYRAAGGGNYPGITGENLVLDPPVGIRDILLDYVQTRDPLDPAPGASWRLIAPAGTSVTFASAPCARDVIAEHAGLDIRALCDDEDGFTTYRLRF